jgi:CheY-like chemotaxis protein
MTAEPDQTERPLILVIEDNPGAAELVTRIVERGGFRAAIARSGTEALERARELHPVAITLDILLPELDGWEVLSRLKRDPTTSHIPVVVVSFVDSPELGMALGALDYFVKPVHARELIARLSQFHFERGTDQQEMRVLVVDDEPANRDYLTRILEPEGFTVTTADGGRSGIQLAKSGRPDLVLLDLMMPDVTGFDVVEALRADEATRAIPIMVLTAKDLTEADKGQLNGHVATVLSRRSTGVADLLGQLQHVVSSSGGTSSAN